jgi:hypothetical protein
VGQRDELRFRLQDIFNEADLLIRNKKADQADLARIKRDESMLKMYSRIPLEEDLPDLERELGSTSENYDLDLIRFSVTARSGTSGPVPASVYTDNSEFHLTSDQLVETISFRVIVRGDQKNVRNWVKAWGKDFVRIIEPQGGYGKLPVQKDPSGKPHRYAVEGQAFRFRDIQFPKLLPRDPVTVLPEWARKNPSQFAKAEPELWRYVEKTRKLAPKAKPLYEHRREFLLNSARFDFFTHKAIQGEQVSMSG